MEYHGALPAPRAVERRPGRLRPEPFPPKADVDERATAAMASPSPSAGATSSPPSSSSAAALAEVADYSRVLDAAKDEVSGGGRRGGRAD